MASYGMNNYPSYVESPGIFGHLQHSLDLDVGRYFPFEIMPNFGLGEVIDASPPVSPLYEVNMENDFGNDRMDLVIPEWNRELARVNHDGLMVEEVFQRNDMPHPPLIPLLKLEAPPITSLSDKEHFKGKGKLYS